ncbi:hypothetical protein COCNU_scaffold000307G000010 [Cocos nucifera]|nr:hypothetical protein [Cocos nucifera]
MAPPPFSQSSLAHVPLVFLDLTPAEVTPPTPPSFSQSPPVHKPPIKPEPTEHAHPTMDLISGVSFVGSTSMGGRRKRGCTRAVKLSTINKMLGKKMEINISIKEGQSINVVQSTKLSNELGKIDRNILPVKPRCTKLIEEVMQIAFDKLEMLKQSISGSHPMTADKIYDKVPRTRPDYIYGLGVGPHPEGKSSSFISKKRLQKELEQLQKHNQEMKNKIVDIKVQMKLQKAQMELQNAHVECQQKILKVLCAS